MIHLCLSLEEVLQVLWVYIKIPDSSIHTWTGAEVVTGSHKSQLTDGSGLMPGGWLCPKEAWEAKAKAKLETLWEDQGTNNSHITHVHHAKQVQAGSKSRVEGTRSA